MLPALLHMKTVLLVSFVLLGSLFASTALAKMNALLLLPPDSEDYFKIALKPVLQIKLLVPSVENVLIPKNNVPQE